MNSRWTDDNINDDLYEAQEKIPVNIYKALNAKTPKHYVFEEHLGEIGACYNDSELRSGPDLQLIHNMLHLVKDDNSHADISQNTENVIEITKINSKCIETNDTVHDIEKLYKKKKQRNVAIASLLEGLTNERIIHDDDRIGQVKLLKPEDFVLKSECSLVTEANNKCDISVKGLITESSAFVFKKKSPDIKVDDNESPKTEANKSNYQPSPMAEVYYKKYLERSRYKEIMHKTTEHVYEKIKGNKDFERAQLPYHRHMLMTDCIVCNVICRKLFESLK